MALFQFSTSYIVHGILFLSFWASLSPLASSRLICLFLRPVIHYSYRLLSALSILCCLYYWAFFLTNGPQWKETILVPIIYCFYLFMFFSLYMWYTYPSNILTQVGIYVSSYLMLYLSFIGSLLLVIATTIPLSPLIQLVCTMYQLYSSP